MGDHEALGLGLCGGIKRVRSMRKWWSSSPPPPAGMLKAPDGVDLTRNDTQQLPSDNESDSDPQPIYPNYRYTTPFWRPWWMRQKYPHPILCGPRGPITVMPDHPHEGEVRGPVPAELTQKIGQVDEYPPDTSGQRVVPEVVAWGRVRAGNTTRGGGKIPTVAHTFGVVSAYDGHRAAGKGRVVCDSTWHHFVNVNLIGILDEFADQLNFFGSRGDGGVDLEGPQTVAVADEVHPGGGEGVELFERRQRQRALEGGQPAKHGLPQVGVGDGGPGHLDGGRRQQGGRLLVAPHGGVVDNDDGGRDGDRGGAAAGLRDAQAQVFGTGGEVCGQPGRRSPQGPVEAQANVVGSPTP
jgi:hypothetical protein